ncbi:MAG: hypothetical protein GY783_09740 [Gammaproteobacteria bacterium]|nr:hypothetical protein [Gammaproteobacteria bacterium]
MGYLKNKLKEIGASRLHAADKIPVLVELSLPEPDDDCIQQLQDAGLTIGKIIGNKVVGHIAGESESALESLPIVTSVERAVMLKSY